MTSEGRSRPVNSRISVLESHMRAAHRSAFLCAAVACAASLLSAQYPPETRRRQLDTPHDEVIFPQELQAYAQRVANRLEALSKPLAQTRCRWPGGTAALPLRWRRSGVRFRSPALYRKPTRGCAMLACVRPGAALPGLQLVNNSS